MNLNVINHLLITIFTYCETWSHGNRM